MPNERDERRFRLEERLPHRGRQPRDDVADEVERIAGIRPGLDEFLSAEATDRLTAAPLLAVALASTVHS